MMIGRALPPAAAPLDATDLWHGILGMFSPEPTAAALEEEIRNYFGVRHVFLVSSGTAALTLTLKALTTVSPRRRAVLPAYTCFSVPAAVLSAGLQPALCDINASTFDFDHDLLDLAVNEDTLCVIAHHLFGIPSDIDRIQGICRARGVVVVEDAAQAMGVEWKGRLLGTCGDVGIFSLGRGKNLTCGSGGVIVTNADPIAEAVGQQCRLLADPSGFEVMKEFVQVVLMAAFIRPCLYWIPASLPFLRLGETIFPKCIPLKRLSGMKAGLLHDWLRRLQRSNRIRSETATDFIRRLSLGLPCGPSRPYLRLPILMATPEEKESVTRLSRKRRLGLSGAYPSALDEIPDVRILANDQRFPCARRVAETLLTVPTHHWLSDEDRNAIVECLGTTPVRANGRSPLETASP